MKDLQNPKWMWLKAGLFVAIATVSGGLLWLQAPNLGNAILLLLLIWASCRAYYFAFYVLEKYVDPGFRFSGLGSLLHYLSRRRDDNQPKT